MSTSTLRSIYKWNSIKQRKFKVKPKITMRQLESRRNRLLEVLPKVMALKDSKVPFYFVDETMYTANDKVDHVWLPPGESICFRPDIMRFKAIAVVAAIDMKGKIVSMMMKHKFIDQFDFAEFLDMLYMKAKKRPVNIFLDNLAVHRTIHVRETAEMNKQTLVFNGPYTSELNPIEHLWQMAKFRFRRNLITEKNYLNDNKMFSLVRKCIRSVPKKLVKKYVEICFRKMPGYMQGLPERIQYPD